MVYSIKLPHQTPPVLQMTHSTLQKPQGWSGWFPWRCFTALLVFPTERTETTPVLSMYTQRYTHIYMHTHIHICTCIHMHTRHSFTHSHTCTRTYIHAQTHTYIIVRQTSYNCSICSKKCKIIERGYWGLRNKDKTGECLRPHTFFKYLSPLKHGFS